MVPWRCRSKKKTVGPGDSDARFADLILGREGQRRPINAATGSDAPAPLRHKKGSRPDPCDNLRRWRKMSVLAWDDVTSMNQHGR
jgi:hypothetical protein